MPLLGRDTWVAGPFPRGVLLLESLVGHEGLGKPFEFNLKLLSRDAFINPDVVVGQPLVVGIKLDTGGERLFHGLVTEFKKLGTTHQYMSYHARIEPALSLLKNTLNCRIFNQPGQTALDIVMQVFADRGLTDVESGAVGGHASRKRDYCVQYRESDLQFVQRLLDEEGIYYFFRHEEDRHVLVLGDSASAHTTLDGYETVLYTTKETGVSGNEHLWDLRVRKSLHAKDYTIVAGYDPMQPRPEKEYRYTAESQARAPGPGFEHYDAPRRWTSPDDVKEEAFTRMHIDEAAITRIEVEGNTLGLGVGHLLSLRAGGGAIGTNPFWREDDFDKQFLITGASYFLKINQYETGQGAVNDEPFRVRYWLMDSQSQFRPRRLMPYPRIFGVQTARVVGPKDEEIWTDELGRVRLQFDWDRQGKSDEKSSCWARVTQAWAGDKWGAINLPRVGHEVVVRFLDGDPEHPVVIGRVYDRDQLPPYELPAGQTQSGIKSRSSKRAALGNYNEIRFDDKKAQELLYLQAEKDMTILVKNDQSLEVGHDRIVNVGHDETNEVHNDRQLTVGTDAAKHKDTVTIHGTHTKTVEDKVSQAYMNDHVRKVQGDQELTVDEYKDEHIGQAFTLTTDEKFQLNQGATSFTFVQKNATLKSAGQIDLLAGGATMTIDKAGTVTIMSPTGITLAAGGAGISILPGSIALSGPGIAAASGGTVLDMGKETINLKSQNISITADTVASVKGKSKIRLQEAEGAKGKKGGGKGGAESAEDAPQIVFDDYAGKVKTDWIEMEVLDERNYPWRGEVQILLPDGRMKAGYTGIKGLLKVAGLEPGEVKVIFPNVQATSATLADHSSATVGSIYRVKAGDCLTKIAAAHGFSDYRTIYDNLRNAAFQKKRPNPNVILPGDEIFIPPLAPMMLKVATGKRHRIVVPAPRAEILLYVQNPDGEPLAGKRYTLTLSEGAKPIQGVTNAEGLVKETVPPMISSARLTFPMDKICFELRIGELDPLAERSGFLQRLQNLGFVDAQAGRDSSSEASALALFQDSQRLDSTGKPDVATLNRLRKLHDRNVDS